MNLIKQTTSAREDLGLLAVMDALKDKENITQRELAQETGLTLKKVHYCLHKLVEKGFVKFQRARLNPDKRTYLYILTPAGLKAKSELTYSFLRVTFNFYNQMEQKLRHCLFEMRRVGIKKIILYGTNDAGRILMEMGGTVKIEVVGFVDDIYDEQEFYNIPVLEFSQLSQLEWDGILISKLDDIKKAEQNLIELGVSEDVIWKLS